MMRFVVALCVLVVAVQANSQRTKREPLDSITKRLLEVFERGVLCPPGEFSCGLGSNACVKIETFCDGKNDCPDGKDEDATKCARCSGKTTPFFCPYESQCVEESDVCTSVRCKKTASKISKCKNKKNDLVKKLLDILTE
jgi:hypothetical protein